MLFRRDIEPNCAYCEHAERVNGYGGRADDNGRRVSDTGLTCAKRGNVTPEGACKAFRYDPLKRVPPRPASLRLGKFREADFSL